LIRVNKRKHTYILDVQNRSCDRGGHVPVRRLHWRPVWTWTLLCEVPPSWHRSEASTQFVALDS